MIEVHEVSFTYPGGQRPAARDLDFRIEEGEIFGFLGPSGAGKTTTQNILIGLLREYSGRVTVMGRPLETWGREYYELIGVSFESPNHYLKLTALENLQYFRSLYRGPTEDPAELLALVGLSDHAHKRVAEFSKGMKNRLNFARSLLHRPRLWFLDEPTAGLDPANAKNNREIITARRAAGTTVFLTTHDMTVADQLCDRVGFIVDGALQVIDAPTTLKRRYGKRTVMIEFESERGGPETREFPLDGLADNHAFLDTLRGRVNAIHSQESTLEAVFLELTGRTLE